jgi:site-specific recombinase XerD
MGSRKWPTGIVPREKSIEIRLNLNDKRRYVNISWLPTPSNIRKAGQIRKNAQEAIKWGQFSWREFFPDSKYAEEESNDKTFGHYAAIYLKTLVCAESTQEKYQESLERFYLSSLSNRLINHIKYTELLSLLANFSWGSNKSRNNALIPLRAVFKLAQRDGAITHNPCEGIENGKHQSPEADPLLQKEWTFLQGNEVFVHPSTGQPFTNNASVRLMWNKGLKACGIRHRSSYQTRHTFCTNCLQSGAKIHWVSKQLGHASAMMTLNRYSKWIEQANAEKESFKLDAFVSSQINNNEQKGAKMGF